MFHQTPAENRPLRYDPCLVAVIWTLLVVMWAAIVAIWAGNLLPRWSTWHEAEKSRAARHHYRRPW